MPRPLLVTAASALLDDVVRLAAAAGTEVEVAPEPAAAAMSWRAAPLVLVGADRLDATIVAGLPRRPDVVVVSTDLDDATVWRRAVGVGAEHVAFLPDGERWVVDRLREATLGAGGGPCVVGVVGARGGAGASVFAVGLAFAGMHAGRRTMLVDADPLGGGIDLLLGVEATPGPRWPDLVAGAVPLDPLDLSAALPRCGELTVVSWARSAPAVIPASRVRELLAVARRGTELVVVDLPRCLDAAARAALDTVSTLFVVTPAEVRACAAGARVVERAAAGVADVRAVVRAPAPSGLTAEQVADALGVPLAGAMRAEPGLAAALERGEPPGRRRGPLARLCDRLVAELVEAAA